MIKCLHKFADLLTHCSCCKFSKAFGYGILDDYWKEDEVDWLKEVFGWRRRMTTAGWKISVCLTTFFGWKKMQMLGNKEDCPENRTPPD